MTMTTRTLTFTPHPDLQLIPEADRLKWADALETSAQHKGSMTNWNDTAHCCLGVAERTLNGAVHADYHTKEFPSRMSKECYTIPFLPERGSRLLLEQLNAATVSCSKGAVDSILMSFAGLNDRYMTHPQIGQLLRGNPVTIQREGT